MARKTLMWTHLVGFNLLELVQSHPMSSLLFFSFPFFPFYFCVPTPKIDLLGGEVSRNYLVLSHSYLRLVQVFVSVCFVWILSLIIT